jgi:hypothetical protein
MRCWQLYRTAPTGKIPYITLKPPNSDEEIKLGDSCLISKYLTEHGMIEDLNEAAHLGLKGKALDAAVRALMEDKLYFFNVCPNEREMRTGLN